MKNSSNCLVAPSILSADFANLGEAVALIERCGGDMVHMDVMDGVFVPEITFGQQMIRSIKRCTKLPLDVHLMVTDPEPLIDGFIESGADVLTFHYESTVHHHRIIEAIKQKGCKAGISIVPSTPVACLTEILPFTDAVLIMSVNPGYGGQKLIPSTLDKIRLLSELKKKHGYNFVTSVDGGVNRSTIRAVHETGVDLIIAGSAFFDSEKPDLELKMLKNRLA